MKDWTRLLLSVLPPPEEVSPRWRIPAGDDATAYPDDYLELMGLYGPGCVDDFLCLLAPQHPNENLDAHRLGPAWVKGIEELAGSGCRRRRRTSATWSPGRAPITGTCASGSRAGGTRPPTWWRSARDATTSGPSTPWASPNSSSNGSGADSSSPSSPTTSPRTSTPSRPWWPATPILHPRRPRRTTSRT